MRRSIIRRDGPGFATIFSAQGGEEADMRDSDIPVKTVAGQKEIGHKQLKLPPRARSLLIMIHGADNVAQLVTSMQSLGDVRAILGELEGAGLVTMRGAGAPAANAPELVPAEVIPPAQLVKQLLNETAVASLGMLGGFTAFRFTLKLEHCYTAEELRGIYPEFRRVVGKAKSEAFADTVIARAEAILAGARA